MISRIGSARLRTPSSAAGVELSETALKLSKVIEREARRRSALSMTPLFRVQQNFPLHRRASNRTDSARSTRSRRSVTAVTPISEDDPLQNQTDSTNVGKRDLAFAPVAPDAAASPTAAALVRLATMRKCPSSHSVVPDPDTATTRTVVGRASTIREDSRSRAEQMSCTDGDEDGNQPETFRERCWEFFDDPQSSASAYYFSVCLFFFISISTVVFIAQTEIALAPYANVFDTIEACCALIFSVEFTLRMLCSPSKWQFIKNFGNWVDLAAILPFYLEAVLNVENAGSFGAIRIVRLTRVARVLKMSRYSSAIQVFVQAISISMKALSMLVFLMSIAMVVFSSAIYFAEYTSDGCRKGGWMGECGTFVNGKAPGNATMANSVAAAAATRAGDGQQCICVDPNPYSSIASSFWWCIVTMSTVGYGDMTPVTFYGKLVGCISVLTGMLVLALPITVIGTNFQKVMKSMVHQTMKTNVDYLKGKRQVCRDEIQAILQRFHAVTEDIHLDIDDIISVYDTDSSGMLEDAELARFRDDLEMLQNRAFMHQHLPPGVGLQSNTHSSSNYSTSTKPMSLNSVAWTAAIIGASTAPSHPPHLPSTPTVHRSNTGPVMSEASLVSSQTFSIIEPGSFPRPAPPDPDKTPEETRAQTAPIIIDTPHSTPTDSSKTSAVTMKQAPAPVPVEQQDPPLEDGADSTSRSRNGSNTVQVPPLMDDARFLLRLAELQHAWEVRLKETEARLEAKMINLTKIMLRVESLMDTND